MTFTHFYSDPHFGHANIIEFEQRPFADVEEMERELVRRYEAIVRPTDHVLWVGDCFWYLKRDFDHYRELLARLPGKKTLVRGNHDAPLSRVRELGWDGIAGDDYDRGVHEGILFTIGGRPVWACHYPPRLPDPPLGVAHTAPLKYRNRRPVADPGVTYMHGHTHERARVGRLLESVRIHVGVDAWAYAPASLGEVETLMEEAWND